MPSANLNRLTVSPDSIKSSAASGQSSPATRKAASKKSARGMLPLTGRARARLFAIQALYQVQIGGQLVADADSFTRGLDGFHKCDLSHYSRVVYGCVAEQTALDEQLQPMADRPLNQISPIEHAILRMGCYEFIHCVDIPWRVVINEYIDLAKSFGGTDGHKYINGVLHRLAPLLRGPEWSKQTKAPSQAVIGAAS
jgi:N utilization substance protein B